MFSFSAPFFLIGILPAGVLIYYLHMRNRDRNTQKYLASAWLQAKDPSEQVISPKIRDPFLALLRFLFLTLLFIGLADPRIEKPILVKGDVVLIDGSLSMAQVYDAKNRTHSRFKQAIIKAEEEFGFLSHYACADSIYNLKRKKSWVRHMGGANLDGCIAELAELGYSNPILFTDFQGVERVPNGISASISMYDSPIPSQTISDPEIQVRDNQVIITNPYPVSLEIQSGQANGMCAPKQSCALQREDSHLRVLTKGTHGEWPFAESLEWYLYNSGRNRSIVLISNAGGQGLYSGHHVLSESLRSIAQAKSYSLHQINDPDSMPAEIDLVVYHWSEIDSPWNEILRRDRSYGVIVIPAPTLADTIAPITLDWAFGSYRGWLARKSDFPSPYAGSIQKRLSIAETDAATVWMTDASKTPIVLYNEAQKIIFNLFPVDPNLNSLSIDPSFIPLLEKELNQGLALRNSRASCVAGTKNANGVTCPASIDSVPSSGTVNWLVDWRETSPNSWKAIASSDSVSPSSDTHQEQYANYFVFAAGILFIFILLLKNLLHVKNKALFSAFVCVFLFHGQVGNAQVPETIRVHFPSGIEPDQQRSLALQKLSVELAKRANVQLLFQSSTDAQNQKPPTIIWANACRSSSKDIQQGLQQVEEFLSAGSVLVFEDCVSGNRDSLAFKELSTVLSQTSWGASWQAVRSNHVLYKTYYLLNRISGQLAAGKEKTIESYGMPVVLYIPQDLSGKVSSRGEDEQSIRSFTNIVFYMLMGNYKEDGIHVPHLLKRLGQGQ